MSYYFIENKYPTDDPNIDLDFTNDTIYNLLIDSDEYQFRQDVPDIVTTEYVEPYNEVKQKPKNKKIKDRTNSVYIFFIVFAIFLVLLWYFYISGSNAPKFTAPIDRYAADAELIMMSPHVGIDLRYG